MNFINFELMMNQFGKIRLNDFCIDPTYINVNHASYGYAPKIVLEEKRKFIERCEFNAQKWYKIDVWNMLNDLKMYIAKRINCKPENLFFIENATDGINSILKSFTWNKGDVILIPNTAYMSVKKLLISLKDRYNITVQYVTLTRQDLKSLQKFQQAVQKFVNHYPNKIKVAIFDHIISVPGLICPVETLQRFFSKKGIQLIIDGAHAINHIDVNIGNINPSAYFSNFHKWAFTPKNAAFLYVCDQYLSTVKPVITSYLYGQGLAKQFFWTGTRDFSSCLSIKKALEYSDSFGENQVQNYNHHLVIKASKRVAEIWKTSLLTEDERCIGNLANIQIPCNDLALASEISIKMLKNDNCYPMVFQFDGKIWVRIAAQIYNELSDYEFMANTFLAYLQTQSQSKQNKLQ